MSSLSTMKLRFFNGEQVQKEPDPSIVRSSLGVELKRDEILELREHYFRVMKEDPAKVFANRPDDEIHALHAFKMMDACHSPDDDKD